MKKLTEEQLRYYNFVVEQNGMNSYLYQCTEDCWDDDHNMEVLEGLGFSKQEANDVIQWRKLRTR